MIKKEKTMLESFLTDKGHLVLFLPKFHCELNPIERVWGEAKRYNRKYTNIALQQLRNILPDAIDSVSATTIRKYVRKAKREHMLKDTMQAVGLKKQLNCISHIVECFTNRFTIFSLMYAYLFRKKYFKIYLVHMFYLIFN